MVLLLLVAFVATGLLVPPPAEAASGRARGTVVGTGKDYSPDVTVAWYTAGWSFIGKRRAPGGAYSLVLAPGTYHLQFTDRRPTYDVSRYAPTDVLVVVRGGSTTVKNVRMRRGAAIGGVVKAGGKVAGGARVVAANTSRNSFETTADKSGRYALGGLPAGTYSVFFYDRRKAYVGRSAYLRKAKAGSYTAVNGALRKRAGRLVVDLYAGPDPYRGVAYVTAVSRRTGQFWTAKAAHGTVTLVGLFPGRYRLVVPGTGNYLGGTFAVRGRVRAGRVSFGSVRLTHHGASITGRVVDANDTTFPLSGAYVTLRDGTGKTLQTAKSATDGTFRLAGQLTTRHDLSIAVGPGPYSDYLGQGTHYCKYATTTRSSISVTSGHTTALGAVALPHRPDADQDGVQCWTPPSVPRTH